MLRFIALTALSLPALADGRFEPPADSPTQVQAQHQSQVLDSRVDVSPVQTAVNSIDVDYPRISAVFGMGAVGFTTAPVSNGPCPMWVQDKPGRSFPGHGRGPTYERDEVCLELTERWLRVLELQAEAARDAAAADRARAEGCRESCLAK